MMRASVAILGAGSMGIPIGALLATAGHTVTFAFGRDAAKLEAAAKAAGPRARATSVPEAVKAADVVILAVPWGAVDAALAEAGALADKIVLSIVNPLKPDISGLAVGTTTSGAEEIAKKIPRARLVAAIPPMSGVLGSPSRRFDGVAPAAFYCGNDNAAKAVAAELLADLDVQAVDAGPLANARFTEPAGMLAVKIQYAPGAQGDYGLHLLNRVGVDARD